MPPSDIYSRCFQWADSQTELKHSRGSRQLIAWKYGAAIDRWAKNFSDSPAELAYMSLPCKVFQPTFFPTIPLHLHCSSNDSAPISSSVSVSSHRYVPEFGFFIFKHLDQIKQFICALPTQLSKNGLIFLQCHKENLKERRVEKERKRKKYLKMKNGQWDVNWLGRPGH